MADKYNVDSHKLMYHPERVSQWLKGYDSCETVKSIYPIYVEISPTGICNHRCTFCAIDFVGYNHVSLDKDILRERITEMKQLGVKSIMFAGEGEPTLWNALPEILEHCTKVGMDTSLTTNMVPISRENIEKFLKNCRWIKTSINAGTRETYSKIHRTKPEDFDKVMDNFKICIEKRKEKCYSCTIGAQMILLSENAHEAVILGEKLRAIGIDYLVIKPYSQHFSSVTHRYEDIDYRPYMKLKEQLQNLNTEYFNIIFRAQSMEKVTEEERGYLKCFSTPFFWGYIMADGTVSGCSAFLKNERFCYGNIHENTFKEIWEGEKRMVSYYFVKNELDIKECRKNCRMDKVNCYLWKLKHPDSHINFI